MGGFADGLADGADLFLRFKQNERQDRLVEQRIAESKYDMERAQRQDEKQANQAALNATETGLSQLNAEVFKARQMGVSEEQLTAQYGKQYYTLLEGLKGFDQKVRGGDRTVVGQQKAAGGKMSPVVKNGGTNSTGRMTVGGVPEKEGGVPVALSLKEIQAMSSKHVRSAASEGGLQFAGVSDPSLEFDFQKHKVEQAVDNISFLNGQKLTLRQQQQEKARIAAGGAPAGQQQSVVSKKPAEPAAGTPAATATQPLGLDEALGDYTNLEWTNAGKQKAVPGTGGQTPYRRGKTQNKYGQLEIARKLRDEAKAGQAKVDELKNSKSPNLANSVNVPGSDAFHAQAKVNGQMAEAQRIVTENFRRKSDTAVGNAEQAKNLKTMDTAGRMAVSKHKDAASIAPVSAEAASQMAVQSGADVRALSVKQKQAVISLTMNGFIAPENLGTAIESIINGSPGGKDDYIKINDGENDVLYHIPSGSMINPKIGGAGNKGTTKDEAAMNKTTLSMVETLTGYSAPEDADKLNSVAEVVWNFDYEKHGYTRDQALGNPEILTKIVKGAKKATKQNRDYDDTSAPMRALGFGPDGKTTPEAEFAAVIRGSSDSEMVGVYQKQIMDPKNGFGFDAYEAADIAATAAQQGYPLKPMELAAEVRTMMQSPEFGRMQQKLQSQGKNLMKISEVVNLITLSAHELASEKK
jgi:hypothetical protein